MHVGIANPRWWGKTFHAFPAHTQPAIFSYLARGPLVMACRLLGANLVPEPVLAYCQLDSSEQSLVKLETIYKVFHSVKFIWKYCLWNAAILSQGEMSWRNYFQMHFFSKNIGTSIKKVTVNQNWFKYWLGGEQAASIYQNQFSIKFHESISVTTAQYISSRIFHEAIAMNFSTVHKV